MPALPTQRTRHRRWWKRARGPAPARDAGMAATFVSARRAAARDTRAEHQDEQPVSRRDEGAGPEIQGETLVVTGTDAAPVCTGFVQTRDTWCDRLRLVEAQGDPENTIGHKSLPQQGLEGDCDSLRLVEKSSPSRTRRYWRGRAVVGQQPGKNAANYLRAASCGKRIGDMCGSNRGVVRPMRRQISGRFSAAYCAWTPWI